MHAWQPDAAVRHLGGLGGRAVLAAAAEMLTAARLRLRILFAALASQRLRAVVAAAMVSLGVASTLVMVALSTGARLEMQALQEQMGKHLFIVRAGERPVPIGRGSGWFVSSRLEPWQASLIEARVPAVAHAIPVSERSALVKLGANRLATTIRGVTPEFFELRNFTIAAGRPIDFADVQAARRVAVIGPFVRERLTGSHSVLGATLRVAGVPFQVVGELRAKGTGTDGSNQDDQILVPLDAAMHRLDNRESVAQLLIQTRDAPSMEHAIDSVRALLREAHHLAPTARDDFDVLTLIQQNTVQRINGRWMRGMSRALAAVTVVLGLVGVFAVSYLNVSERRGEIGLRMAVGATRFSIGALFVSEACVLSAIGGLAGLALGALVTGLVSAMTSWPAAIDVRSIALPFAASVAIGVMCSLGPALRAAYANPARVLAG